MLQKNSNASYPNYRGVGRWNAAKNLYPGLVRPVQLGQGRLDRRSAFRRRPVSRTCTDAEGNTVTVTNPGSKSGVVGTAATPADDRLLVGRRRADLDGHRPPGRSVDQRHHRPDQRYADHGGHVQRDRHRQGLHQRRGHRQLHLDDHRWRQPEPGHAGQQHRAEQLLGLPGPLPGLAHRPGDDAHQRPLLRGRLHRRRRLLQPPSARSGTLLNATGATSARSAPTACCTPP